MKLRTEAVKDPNQIKLIICLTETGHLIQSVNCMHVLITQTGYQNLIHT